MYARLVQFKMGPGTKNTADEVRKQFSKALTAQKGLVRVYFFGDVEAGKYFSLALWKTKKDGEVAFEEIQPQLQEALKNLVEEPPQSEYLEVFEVAEPA